MLSKLEIHTDSDNISRMYTSTAVTMIFASLTSVIAVLIDGIIASRFLGSDIYSGMALIRPFTSVVLVLSGFVSTGCSLVCSRLVGAGEKEKANEVFNVSSVAALLFAAVIILGVVLFPETTLRLCGVFKAKYPELLPHMYGYLHGYMIGIPALLLVQIFGPVFVMDNKTKLFTISSAVLCIADITGDLLNAFVFHGGAFGMGIATSAGYILQLLVLFFYFRDRDSFFRLSPKLLSPAYIPEIIRSGSPAFVKRAASALKDILINYINLIVALSTAAIAARGIQNDLFQLIFCFSTGLGRTLSTMSGTMYSANDLQGLKRLYSYSMKLGVLISGICAVIAFAIARPIALIYSHDAEIISLAVFSIRWTAVGLIFDSVIALLQHYLQAVKELKLLNVLCFAERLIVPVAAAFVLGLSFGSKGVLASAGISKIILILGLFAYVCWRCKGLPKSWTDVMFLPKDFGGADSDNMYGEIRTVEDAVRESKRSYDFCLAHGAEKRKALFTSLCVEEMAVSIIDHARKTDSDHVCADFRLFVSEGRICFSLRDLSNEFNPTVIHDLHSEESPEAHLGVRMVTKMAKDIRYFSAFNSNNLIIYMD